jgi:membrane protein implicated in regulation of membrane protease activity
VDPFCLFAVVPILIVGGLFIWSGIALLGVPLIVLALLIVVVDSWANRPVRKQQDRRHDDDY